MGSGRGVNVFTMAVEDVKGIDSHGSDVEAIQDGVN